jgi:uncharacterized membrane protein YbhN (UPF0104 family)
VTRRRLWGAAQVLLCVLVVAFFGYQLWRVRDGIGPSLHAVGWGNAALATALAAVGGVPGYFGWRILLTRLDIRLPTATAVRIYFLAGLTRYLPGGVWPAVAHAAQARPLGESPVRMAGAYLVSQGLGLVAGLAVGLVALPWLVAANALWWLLLPAMFAALVPVVVPGLLGRLLVLAQRLLRRDARPPELPDPATLLASTGLMTVGWLISGLHVAVLAVALGAPPLQALTVGIGGFALSVLAGVATVVTPSGLGARELILGLTLATLLTGPGLVTLVALSRVLITVADLVPTVAVLALLAATTRAPARPLEGVTP